MGANTAWRTPTSSRAPPSPRPPNEPPQGNHHNQAGVARPAETRTRPYRLWTQRAARRKLKGASPEGDRRHKPEGPDQEPRDELEPRPGPKAPPGPTPAGLKVILMRLRVGKVVLALSAFTGLTRFCLDRVLQAQVVPRHWQEPAPPGQSRRYRSKGIAGWFPGIDGSLRHG